VTSFRRGAEAIHEAAGVSGSYAIANCGWGYDVLQNRASIGWIEIGDTRLLPPEYREPGFTVYSDPESSDAIAQSADLVGALRHLVPEDVAAWLARGIVGREVCQVAWPMETFGDDPEQDWRTFWIYDPERLTLTGTRGMYSIPLEQLTTSAQMLNAIFQVQGKPWCDPTMAGMLLAALQELLMPQHYLCSWGDERGPIKVAGAAGERPPIT